MLMRRHNARRAVVPLLMLPLALATSSCFAAGPDPVPTPLPSSQRPQLLRQAKALKDAINDLADAYPTGQIASRSVIDDAERDCHTRDPDDPAPEQTTRNWEYALRLKFTPETTSDQRNETLKGHLRRNGWALGDDHGTMIATNGGAYLEIILSAPNTDDHIAIRGHSRCVRADGKITSPDPPGTTSPT